MAAARAILDKLKTKDRQKENSDGSGPAHLRQTEKAGSIRLAPARKISDKLKTNEKAEGEFEWLRPGPS